MTTPNATVDPRFGDSTVGPRPWEDAEAALTGAPLFWISTVRADGRPHVTPLIALWLDDAIVFTTGPAEQKARNLAANPNCIFTTGQNTWDSGFDVVVEGTAIRITEPERLQQVADAYEAKYGDAWLFEVANGGLTHREAPPEIDIAHVYEVKPAKVLGFGKDPHSQTRWTFA